MIKTKIKLQSSTNKPYLRLINKGNNSVEKDLIKMVFRSIRSGQYTIDINCDDDEVILQLL